jgi:hypothetical protein
LAIFTTETRGWIGSLWTTHRTHGQAVFTQILQASMVIIRQVLCAEFHPVAKCCFRMTTGRARLLLHVVSVKWKESITDPTVGPFPFAVPLHAPLLGCFGSTVAAVARWFSLRGRHCLYCQRCHPFFHKTGFSGLKVVAASFRCLTTTVLSILVNQLVPHSPY